MRFGLLIFEGTHLLISTFFLCFSFSVYLGESENLSQQFFRVFFLTYRDVWLIEFFGV